MRKIICLTILSIKDTLHLKVPYLAKTYSMNPFILPKSVTPILAQAIIVALAVKVKPKSERLIMLLRGIIFPYILRGSTQQITTHALLDIPSVASPAKISAIPISSAYISSGTSIPSNPNPLSIVSKYAFTTSFNSLSFALPATFTCS